MASESTFDLEDLNAFFAVKKEKTSPFAPKSRAMTTRSSKTSKKRKVVDTINLEEPSDLSIPDLLKRYIDYFVFSIISLRILNDLYLVGHCQVRL
ncbi:hypothetical protein E3N88_18380 [Mikania micrantha]|uniref:Uncharacterized protein n=1 Tax=Mikania micrantha TaxID=192012 RepID=A0A5N6NKM5_9ASTR|nr:hypothetical protein E3N88_18380 [Mikania micrantha]